jgi:alpha-1,2-mannosyltransferase
VTSSRRAALLWRLAGVGLLAVSAGHVLHTYLVTFPGELWQLDLEVYRDGAASLVSGRPVYDWLTPAPQFLPFTYPPFAALAAVPLLLVPFTVAGWLWSILQVVLAWVCAGIAFRPFVQRFGTRGGLAQGAVAAVLMQLQPVQDGVRFGQVNAVVVTLCLVDLGRRAPGWWPRGSLVGLAAAVKLTPATFWLHFAVARRWRALAASVTAAGAATVLTAAVSPSASAAFWTDALLDPERLGPNDGTSNQSIRGALMRIGPTSDTAQTVVWAVLAIVVCVLGFRLSTRLDRLDEQVAVVACVGMVAVLVSPVSWIHHWHWGIVVIGALLGDGRSRRRVVAALAATTVLALKLPWWGGAWPGHGPLVTVLGRIVEQSYTLFAIFALVALWRLVARPSSAPALIAQPDQSAVTTRP